MAKKSKLLEIGMLNILNQLKNPLTNIRLSVEVMESSADKTSRAECCDIIKQNALVMETSIRDLCNSFEELGISLHVEHETRPI